MRRAERRWDRKENIDMWEAGDFFLTELFSLRMSPILSLKIGIVSLIQFYR